MRFRDYGGRTAESEKLVRTTCGPALRSLHSAQSAVTVVMVAATERRSRIPTRRTVLMSSLPTTQGLQASGCGSTITCSGQRKSVAEQNKHGDRDVSRPHPWSRTRTRHTNDALHHSYAPHADTRVVQAAESAVGLLPSLHPARGSPACMQTAEQDVA